MPAPAQPIFPASVTDTSRQQARNNEERLSSGAWAGIAISVAVCLAWILRYSHLASPFWFIRMKRLLGLRPSSRTPISHQLIYIESGPCITQPEPAHITPNSKDTLPLYHPTSRFSSDILDALLGLGTQPGTYPPSYRSKLSTELKAAMGNPKEIDELKGSREQSNDRAKDTSSKEKAQTREESSPR